MLSLHKASEIALNQRGSEVDEISVQSAREIFGALIPHVLQRPLHFTYWRTRQTLSHGQSSSGDIVWRPAPALRRPEADGHSH